MKINSIVILCGGFGSRIADLTINKPKILIDIVTKPFLYHLLKIFKKNRIKNIYLLTYYKKNQIVNYIKNLKGFNFFIFNDGKNNLGTGGSLKKNLHKIPEYFYLTYGDSYLDFDYSTLKKKLINTNKSIITIFKNKSRDHNNNILLLKKKLIKYNKGKRFNYIDYGLFLLKKKDLQNINIKKNKFGLNSYISNLIKKNKISYVISKNKFYECGSYDGIEMLEKKIKLKNL